MIKKEIENLIKKLVPKETTFSVGRPPQKNYGDYSAFFRLKQAKDLENKIRKKKPSFLKEVEVAGSGFLNFYLEEGFLQKQIPKILKEKEKFGNVNIGKNKKTNIEFISANPTGDLHIGNGRSSFFGDALANILKKAGHNAAKEYYINNARNSVQIQELGRTALGEGESYLTPKLKLLIKELDSTLKKINGNESEAGFFLAENIHENNRKFIEGKLKIKFDRWVSEQNLYRENKLKDVFGCLEKKGLVYKKDGAIWLKSTKYGCQKDDVLVRKNGEATYFLSDIAYHKDKVERGFKKIIDIWGADHQGHVQRLKAAMKMLGHNIEFEILITQMVSLKSGKKLSKRKGDIVALEELVDEVGLDAARYFFLSKSLSSQMVFDLELAKEKSEKNPVYYIQYAHARICSILRKCGKSKIQNPKSKNLKLLNHESELNLIKELVKFPDIIEETTKDYQLQKIPEYGRTLANAFNQFYRDCKIIKADSDSLCKARFALAMATKIVLKNTLDLVGISAPEKM